MTKPRSVAATANANSINGENLQDGTVLWDKIDPSSVDISASSVEYALIGTFSQSVEDKLGQSVSVRDFGALGDGTDATAQIQAAMDYAKPLGLAVFVPAGTYLISSPLLNHSFSGDLIPPTPNGVILYGEGYGSILKAGPGFPANRAMLELNANPDNAQDFYPPGFGTYNQSGNAVIGLKFDGSNVAERGLLLRGNWFSEFKNLLFKDFAGGNGDGVIIIRGVTTPTKDDVDTTARCIFDNIQIFDTSGAAIWAIDSRNAALLFSNVTMRNCALGGVRLAGGFIRFERCSATNCGSLTYPNTSGGFKIVRPLTQAVTRNISFVNCTFENNYWFEFDISYCEGWSIKDCGGTPYKRSTTGANQHAVRVGTDGLPANNGTISNLRLQNYGTPANGPITAFKIGADVSSLLLSNNSIGDRYYTDGVVYDINPAAGVTKDGYSISKSSFKPSALVQNISGVVNLAAVTGDGTVYLTGPGSGTFFSQSSRVVDFNTQGFFAEDPTDLGLFVAEETGLFEVGINWPVTNFSASMNLAEVGFKKISSDGLSESFYPVTVKKLVSYSASDVEIFSGTLQLSLQKGEKIAGYLKISGGTKTAAIDRSAPAKLSFWGRAF